MGFCPYFLHEKSSGGISAIFMLIAGTLVTVFCLNFLYQEQWHRPEEPPLHLPERLFSEELHFLFNEDEERGGFPPEPGVTRPGPTEKINHLLKLINRHISHHFNLHRRFPPALRRLMLLLRQQSDERMNAFKPRRRLLHHRTLLQLLREGEINTPAVSAVSVIHHKVHCHGRPNQRNRENVIWNKSQNDAIGEAKEKKKGRGVDDKVDSR
nr:hypothetical protein Iba_chr11cCG7060 [Ipomoea batatas]